GLIASEIARLEAGRSGPVIAAGSTGTNAATARLLAAIARAPQGALVLPGLDRTLGEDAWRLIGGAKPRGDRDSREPAASHPQAALHRLLRGIGVDRDEVREIGVVAPALSLRTRFVS